MSRYYSFAPYVPVAKRRANAAKEAAKMSKRGVALSPVTIPGRAIASTFWGKAWCEHLESYSDFSNRLPRGRTYARNGSVIDLKIEPTKISALVMGSSLYRQTISVSPIAPARWKSIKAACAGSIDSLVELLQGRFSNAVMGVITHRDHGMFPAPKEIQMSCSCPDWAGLCKHLAAVLYGVGARLDTQPELFFTLRKADHLELLSEAASAQALPAADSAELEVASLADVFGIDLVSEAAPVELAQPDRPAVRPRANSRATPKAKPKNKLAKAAPKPAKTSAKSPAKAAIKPSKAPKTSRFKAPVQAKSPKPKARKPAAKPNQRGAKG
jgi:uncharacterized Zn finger protein